jgi:hypothetical protein
VQIREVIGDSTLPNMWIVLLRNSSSWRILGIGLFVSVAIILIDPARGIHWVWILLEACIVFLLLDVVGEYCSALPFVRSSVEGCVCETDGQDFLVRKRVGRKIICPISKCWCFDINLRAHFNNHAFPDQYVLVIVMRPPGNIVLWRRVICRVSDETRVKWLRLFEATGVTG